MSPIEAVTTPSWESVFASSLGADEMDMSASMGDVGESQWKLMPATTSADQQEDVWSSNNLPHSFQSNDEAMFNSLIQEDSFE